MSTKKEKDPKDVENSGKQPSATFLNSIVTSVRLADKSLRHVQVSIFEDDETHELRIYYDVIDPSQVKFDK